MKGLPLLWAVLASGALTQRALADGAALLPWAGDTWRGAQDAGREAGGA